MADPVTPEATESFGNKGYNVKVGLLGVSCLRYGSIQEMAS